MTKLTIGILDYGAGNFASVSASVHKLGYRSRFVQDLSDFENIDLLLIPGVGAFSSAMKSLDKMNLITPIQNFAKSGGPVLGICLGMQLLADVSEEHGVTRGLELIPGKIVPLREPKWHIGWNTLEVSCSDKICKNCDGLSYYFNHSYEFIAPDEFVVAKARMIRPMNAIVAKGNIYGIQFHPEKSQGAGLEIIGNAIRVLTDD